MLSLSAAEMHTSQWSSYHTRISETKTRLLGWLGFSPTFGKDSDGVVQK